jgi:hypothetical protein
MSATDLKRKRGSSFDVGMKPRRLRKVAASTSTALTIPARLPIKPVIATQQVERKHTAAMNAKDAEQYA